MSSQASGNYYLPQPSHWPIVAAIAMAFLGFGASFTVNSMSLGPVLLGIGFLVLFFMFAGWFTTVAHESEAGSYGKQVDVSFRWGMGWFIFSEVMFFAAFFGVLFYMRVISVPDLGSLEHQQLLWPGFKSDWPATGPGIKETFSPMGAWGIPALNTAILLTSGVTITWAHWGLLKNNRTHLIWGLVLTIALGMIFLGFQIYEYVHAYNDLNLKLTMGAYGATFFMLTGFHGFHVTVGTIMLWVILFRSVAGHFKPDSHFGFEGVAWYWHFVDVVWLLLFVVVYWL
ncbi:MAG: cytochrome c oxidase subunit 3 [Betaproteobacteria bacterium]|jgi:cytochrome c oxidase subunit 3|nr:cytochrome c oxidase subunit 3 [Betaproteobacteria bacterium]MDH4292897.1 cytochrome c oxidase subunit 3 [Betaproteobacteria bacterium]